MLDVEVADDAEGHGTDEVDEQILHGIVQPDIQIPVKAQIRAVDGHRVDAVDGDGGVAVGGVQHHGGNALHHGVLLHIQMEHPVHAELEELPQHPHGHGEAEGRQRHIYRRQLELDAAVAVQDVDKGKARGGTEEARGGVEHGVPVGVGDEVTLQLPQYLRCENEQQDNDLQHRRQLDTEVLLNEKRQDEQRQHQQTDEGAFIFAPDD